MIGRMLMLTACTAATGFMVGVAHSSFKHYYQRFAEEEDMNDGTIHKVSIIADETKKTRGRK